MLQHISIKSIVRNALYYLGVFGEFFAMPNLLPQSLKTLKYSFLIPNILGFALLLCFAYPILRGMRAFWRANSSALFVYIFMLGSMCLLILWPALQGLRFTFGILPFVVFLGALGLESFSPKAPATVTKRRVVRALRILSLGIIAFFVLKSTAYVVRDFANHHSADSKSWEAYSSDALAVYEYIKTHTSPDEIIVFFKPRVLYLNTNRLSLAIREPQTLYERLRSAPFVVNGKPHTIAYILSYTDEYALEHGLSREFIESIGAQKAYENPSFTLYRLADSIQRDLGL